ncbi:class D beta-lactamase [Chitinophaga lutea]
MKQFLFLMLAAVVGLGSCAPNNVKNAPEWEQYFTKHKVEGCFMLFDNGQGMFRVYNIDRAKQRMLPASSFKIFNALAGLQTGAISDTNMVIKWDSVVRRFPEWNQDLPMGKAFRVSSVPYFQEVARRIGKEKMQFWLDTVGYGNKKISKIDTFWLDNSLQISADEQLGLVKQLYFNQLPFQKRAQELVTALMLQEETPQYKLAYKTGWGMLGSKQIGWVVGWIEENRHPAFFAMNIETEDPNFDMIANRYDILRSILKEEGFFEGKK